MKKYLKKIIIIIMLLSIIIVSLVSNNINVEAASPKISKSKIVLINGQTYTLKVKNTDKKIKWISSNKKIATVNSSGKVTAKKVGTATITGKIGSKKYSCSVIIESPSINSKKATLFTKETLQLTLNNNTQNVKWSSSDKKIATVNKNGIVTAKKAGKVEIKAQVGIKKYTCKITVKNTTYGVVEGNVTWQYNRYIGTRADTGAFVALIPKDTNKIKGLSHYYFSMLMNSKNNENGIYMTKVDGFGQYSFGDVPTGEYTVLIVSKNTTSSLRFYNEDIWNNQINGLFSSFLSGDELSRIKIFIGFNSFRNKSIKVEEDKTTTITCDFGYTFI